VNLKARDWGWLLAINAIANLIADYTLNHQPGGLSWVRLVVRAWPGFIISTTISTMCIIVIPRIAAKTARRVWFRWAIVIPTLIVLAIAGSALAVGLLTLAGHIKGWPGFVATLNNTIKMAIAMTLVFGIYHTITMELRSELAETTLALRTKERDEAEARRLASEAQLASLEARVNPHFFFNTLNSIAALASRNPARAERMTTQLASLMRSSLDVASTPQIPLAQEIQHVRDYLEIEQVRFEHRLRYEIAVGADAGTTRVPRLAVQTLVENSVNYAASTRREGATITVLAERLDGRVRIDVIDDGPGFDLATVPEGHGLSLIVARLHLLHGKTASLAVDRRDDRTVVSIELPEDHGH
jgi:sensor histidine kinase YesM